MAALFLRTNLQSLDRYLHNRDDFYPAALHLLGQGFEHLLKLTLALAQLRTQEAMGSPDEMKRIGHDLPGLRDQLVEQLLHPSLVTLPGGEGFLHAAMVLKSSSVNDYLLGLLSDYGRGARYFYLEDLLGRRRKSHPHDAFERSANIIDDGAEVKVWVRLQRGDLPILWSSAGREYNPDFIVIQKDGAHWVVEVKMDKEMTSADVAGKREAAKRWAQHVSADPAVGVKWGYVLVSESDVKAVTGSWPALRSLGVG